MTRFGESVSFALIRFLSFSLARLSDNAALAIGKALGFCAFYLSNRRRVAYADMKAAFGDRYSAGERRKIVRRQFEHLGQMGVEILRFPSLTQEYLQQRIEVHHKERFDQAMRDPKGAVLVTGHLGNWELLQIVSSLYGQPLHVLARTQKQKRFNEWMNRLRESHGSTAVGRGMGIRELFRCLKQHGTVGVLGDQDAGKQGGVILPFLGRKTTVPTGAFEMARRTGAALLPCFGIRKENGRHEIFVEEVLECGRGAYRTEDLVPVIRDYVALLEAHIRRHPEQWLWGGKRWKYTWTKRLLILSDGKAGHLKQAQAIAEQMSGLETQYGRAGMEYPSETLEVAYKSPWLRKVFPVFAFLALPWIQGRLDWLRFFFTESTFEALKSAGADFVISGGSSLIPVNLCLAKENRAKSIVLMKPSFPFNFLRYDLAVVPAHDQGHMPKETFRTLLAPSLSRAEMHEASAEQIKPGLRDSRRVKIGVLLGGDTRNFKMSLADIERMVTILERIAPESGDYLITTSRRTPEEVERFLKSKAFMLKGCQMLVIAREDPRPEVAGGILALADVIIVTEDSISMISEALMAGKKVIVLSLSKEDLPQKHQRFQNLLVEKSAVAVSSVADLESHLKSIDAQPDWQQVLGKENVALQRRLEAIL